jgi:hypothetical protein
MSRLFLAVLLLWFTSAHAGGPGFPFPGPGRAAVGGGGAVAFDAASSSLTQAAGTGFTFTHTTGSGSNRLLVCVAVQDQNATPPSAATYNSVSMTTGATSTATGDNSIMRMFWLAAPATGANTVSITRGATGVWTAAGCMSFSGANQTTPIGTVTYAATLTTGGSVTVPTNGIGMDASYEQAASPGCQTINATGAGQTRQFATCINNGAGASLDIVGSTRATTGTISYSGTTLDGYENMMLIPIGP